MQRRAWVALATIGLMMVAAGCDDGDGTAADTGPVVDMETDGTPEPEPDVTPGPEPDMDPGPEPDVGPPPCTEDVQCAVDAVCGEGRCVEGECVVEPIEGCCTDDAECDDGETCDLDNNTCVADVDLCADVVCDSPPGPACNENGEVVTFGDDGTCEVVDGSAECRYEGSAQACPARQTCQDGGCVADVVADACIFAGPAEIEVFAGSPVTLAGRVFEAGLTDLTDGVDADLDLVAEAGWMAEGADAPMWARAEADPAWSAEEAGAPGFDQYLATVDAPAPGVYALSYRFSLDGGASWLRCDLDGSENGFQDEQTGTLTALAGACDDDPCAEAPPAACEGDDAVTYAPAGACEAVDGEAQCTHDEESRQDCAAAGGRCEQGACVDLAPNPGEGEVIITEILYDAVDPLSDGDAEWVELLNLADGPRYLGGCEVYDDGNVEVLAGGLIPAGGRIVLGHSADREVNGGVDVAATFEFRLGNDGDLFGIRCNGLDVDEVDYTQNGFVPVSGASLSLDPSVRDAGANDDGPGWCPAADGDVYFGEPGEAGAHRGTPGAANPACPPPSIDYCRLQFPEAVRAEEGTTFEVFGVLYEATWTDDTPEVDFIPGLIAEAGHGPDGSDPAGNADWQWVAGAGNPEWDGAARGEPDNDEYVAELTVPAPGDYDYAWRVSLDRGETWTYCDLGAGSEDGYQPRNAGQLEAIPVGGDLCDGFVCPPPPAPRCADDGVTIISPRDPGVCEAVDGQAQCNWPEDRLECPPGARCIDGECFVPAAPPAVGEAVITEFLYDATGDLADADGEWIELYNASDREVGLDGCTIGDDAGNTSALGAINVAPGGYVLLARNGDPAANGGLQAQGTFDFGLGNEGDRIALTCDGVEIDAVAYDVGGNFPAATAYSVSLDPDQTGAFTNDIGANWCRTLPVYFDAPGGDHHGTPGGPNPSCPTLTICTLLSPDEANVALGEDVESTALLVAAGITDRSRGVDADVRLRGGVGYGPAGSDPTQDRTWVWMVGQGDPENDAANADTYRATLADLPPGRYDVAWRFSADDGRSYAFCDREPGSINGYQPADAGHVVVGDPADPCLPNPCDEPPPSECRDADTEVAYAAVGACADEGGLPVCEYAEEITACPLGCADGACVRGEVRDPLPGDLVITEILYDPHDGLEDNTAEYFELYNASDAPLSMRTCVFADANNESPADDVEIEVGEYAVFARSADPAVNGGLENVRGVFDFGLNNTDDSLTVSCGGIIVDTVTYDERGGFPPVRGFSIQLRDGAVDPALNDDPASWCPSRTRYSVDPAQWGSPGAPNPPCDSEVDFCRLQFPSELQAEFETVQIVYGRIYEEGITDLSPLNDGTGLILAAVGYGPDGSLPMDNPEWVWTPGFPNADYDGAGGLGEPNNDEYRADVVMPIPGEYDLAFRFSVDGGRTWQVCDSGDAGSSDGYRVEDAGRLVVDPPANPCAPNPCVNPPVSVCDGNTAVTYPDVGVCGVDAIGLATCDYPEQREDCVDAQCVNGACGGARLPAPGEVIVSEILYDPHNGLDENFAEWIELYNTTDTPLSLDGCEIADSASGTPIAGVEIAARGYALFARVDDPILNGGLQEVDGTFDFSLTNGGDEVNLRCDGALIDTVNYDDGGAFPDARAASINLSSNRLDAQQNDLGRNWCLAEDPYIFDPEHLGTPRLPNRECPAGDPCDPNPCADAPAAFCEGDVAVSYGVTACEAVDGEPVCIPPEEIREDCGAAGCVDGLCDAAGARAPEPGDIVVNEIQRNTEGEIDEQAGEWFELINVSGELLDLAGCEVRDRANGLAVGDLLVPADAILLFARSLNPAANGGIAPDGIFNFSLNNGGDIVELRCGQTTIDAVDYALAGFPGNIPAVAYQLDPDFVDAELNDLGEAWCNATGAYFDGDPPHFGTPGQPNPSCGDNLGACDPNPCVDVPEDECLDATTVAAYHALGTCNIVDDAATCDYDFDLVDCGAIGQACAAGRCVSPDAIAGEGDVVFSEMLYDPQGVLAENQAEWIELTNTTDRDLVLDGCTMGLEGGASTRLTINLAAGGVALLARSADPEVNGGLQVAQTFDFALPNAAGRLNLYCGAALVDTFGYDDGFTFPDASAASISLDPDAYDFDANDEGINWCLGEVVYFADPGGDAALDHLGTPGLPNPQCPEVDVTVDDCRFNFPVVPTEWQAGGFNPPLEVTGLVFEAGITDRSPLVDLDGLLVAEGGYGPRGSDPAGNLDWSWTPAIDTPGYNGDDRGTPAYDEYTASFDPGQPVSGAYDMAFRFSVDGGRTWAYCDSDGLENGYSAEAAIDLDIVRDPCADVFCFDPPPAFCQDPTTVAFYGGDGQCVVGDDGQPTCEYRVNFTDNCADFDFVCVDDEFGAFCGEPM